jgi:hypothetical protein
MFVLWSDVNRKYYGKIEGEICLVDSISDAKKFSWFNPLRHLFKYYVEKYKNDDVRFKWVVGLDSHVGVDNRMKGI